LNVEIRKLLGLRPQADELAELQNSLARAQEQLAASRVSIADMEDRHAGLLLDGDDDAILAHEATLIAARRDADRLAMIVTALPGRIAAAEAREREAGLDRLAAQAEATAVEGAGLMPEIVAAIERLALLVQQHDAHALRVIDANRELHAADRERVALPLARAWPHNPRGERVALLGKHMVLPGPRRGCASLDDWQNEVRRFTAA
jgi:hypothetical protein